MGPTGTTGGLLDGVEAILDNDMIFLEPYVSASFSRMGNNRLILRTASSAVGASHVGVIDSTARTTSPFLRIEHGSATFSIRLARPSIRSPR